jgi:hypothetical protein
MTTLARYEGNALGLAFADTVPASAEAVRLADLADSTIGQIHAALQRARQVVAETGGVPDNVKASVNSALNSLEGVVNNRLAPSTRNELIEGRLPADKFVASAQEIMYGVGAQLQVLNDFSYWSNAKASFDATVADLVVAAKAAGRWAQSNILPWVLGAGAVAFFLYFVVPKLLLQRKAVLAGARRRREIEAGDDSLEDEEEEIEETDFEGNPDREFHIRMVKGRSLKGLGGRRRR